MRLSVLIVAIAIGWMVYAGAFFQTGAQWFQSCWVEQNEERKPATPDESIAWSQCESVAQRAVFGSGFVTSGRSEHATTPETKALANACPGSWSDVPIGGFKYLAVQFIEKTGGPMLIDKFTPPDAMIERVFKSKWPNCQATVKANNFPKIILRGETWEFESPCKPCETDAKARAAVNKPK